MFNCWIVSSYDAKICAQATKCLDHIWSFNSIQVELHAPHCYEIFIYLVYIAMAINLERL